MGNSLVRAVWLGGFAIGVGLVFAGWGGMKYAHEQQMSVSMDGGARLSVWRNGYTRGREYAIPTGTVMEMSVVAIGSGAFLAAFCGPSVLLRRKNLPPLDLP